MYVCMIYACTGTTEMGPRTSPVLTLCKDYSGTSHICIQWDPLNKDTLTGDRHFVSLSSKNVLAPLESEHLGS